YGDWSADVCSSDLVAAALQSADATGTASAHLSRQTLRRQAGVAGPGAGARAEIGTADPAVAGVVGAGAESAGEGGLERDARTPGPSGPDRASGGATGRRPLPSAVGDADPPGRPGAARGGARGL